MHGLSEVAEYLKSKKISFQENESQLVLQVVPDIDSCIVIVEDGENSLAIQAGLPIGTDVVPRANELVRVLQKKLTEMYEDGEDTFDVDFEPDDMVIWVMQKFPEQDAEDEILLFISLVNYCLLPLLIHVEESGGWDERFLTLAFMNPCREDTVGLA